MNDLTFLGLGYIGAGLGIGKLAAGALDGTARQPEAGPALRTTMIIAAALIEGVAFLALVICMLAVMNFAMPKAPAAPGAAPQSQSSH